MPSERRDEGWSDVETSPSLEDDAVLESERMAVLTQSRAGPTAWVDFCRGRVRSMRWYLGRMRNAHKPPAESLRHLGIALDLGQLGAHISVSDSFSGAGDGYGRSQIVAMKVLCKLNCNLDEIKKVAVAGAALPASE